MEKIQTIETTMIARKALYYNSVNSRLMGTFALNQVGNETQHVQYEYDN